MWAKRRTGRFHRAVLLAQEKVVRYTVYFEEDDTLFDEVMPGDVLNWFGRGHPPDGFQLMIRGEVDGEMLTGRIFGVNTVRRYKVSERTTRLWNVLKECGVFFAKNKSICLQVRFAGDKRVTELGERDVYFVKKKLMRFVRNDITVSKMNVTSGSGNGQTWTF